MKHSLVFLSPVVPSFSGNGLAMRAAHNLRALAGEFSVHLLIIGIFCGPEAAPDRDVAALCSSWKWIDASIPPAGKLRWSLRNRIRWGNGLLPPEWCGWNAGAKREALDYFEKTRCERVWVFRFYLFPWVEMWLRRGGKAWLDLDESESRARQSQADLFRHLGRFDEEFRALHSSAKTYRDLEARILPRFERIVTASKLEAERLRGIVRAVEVWPNIISLPAAPCPARESSRGELRLLFIGSLGHFPNREAARFAALEVLPRLEKLAARKAVLAIAGAGADAHNAGFAGLERIEWLGTVSDVFQAYADADIVIVPIHAGGGTRIKILEAFAHCKPVVSTTIGAEGLDVADGRELLLADDPADMAECCMELLQSRKKREQLVAAGYAFVRSRHTEENLKPLAAALARSLSSGSQGRG